MRLRDLGWKSRLLLIGGLLGSVTLGLAQSSSAPKSTPHSTTAKKKSVKHSKRSLRAKKRGQQKIESERTREIQEALIRDHYLDGEASGSWDSATQKAMVRYQSDHGWQTKVIPDSRALITLGLGPDHEHLLNPETAMTSMPDGSRAVPNGQKQKTDPPKQ